MPRKRGPERSRKQRAPSEMVGAEEEEGEVGAPTPSPVRPGFHVETPRRSRMEEGHHQSWDSEDEDELASPGPSRQHGQTSSRPGMVSGCTRMIDKDSEDELAERQ